MLGLLRLSALLVSLLALASCDPPRGAARPQPEQTSIHEVRGVVHSVDRSARRAVIDHEAIPGYMGAMAMEFSIPAEKDLAGLQANDEIAFRLLVTDRKSWVDQVRKLGVAARPLPPATPKSVLADGDPIPDGALVDQDGRPFRLGRYRGSPLAITFIFTRCPLPDFCPRLASHFRTVQEELERTGRDARLLSISIDPTYDTPARLAPYAASYSADSARWTFATGEVAEIERLAAAFGLSTMHSGGELDHTLRTIVVTPSGRVAKIFRGNEWSPADLLVELRHASSGGER